MSAHYVSFIYDVRKKAKNPDPNQQPADIDHPPVLQWTYIVFPSSKNDVSEFFSQNISNKINHLYNSFFVVKAHTIYQSIIKLAEKQTHVTRSYFHESNCALYYRTAN